MGILTEGLISMPDPFDDECVTFSLPKCLHRQRYVGCNLEHAKSDIEFVKQASTLKLFNPFGETV